MRGIIDCDTGKKTFGKFVGKLFSMQLDLDDKRFNSIYVVGGRRDTNGFPALNHDNDTRLSYKLLSYVFPKIIKNSCLERERRAQTTLPSVFSRHYIIP